MTPRIAENYDNILESKYIQTDFKTIATSEYDESKNESKFKKAK